MAIFPDSGYTFLVSEQVGVPDQLVFPSGRKIDIVPRSHWLPSGMNYFKVIDEHTAEYNGVRYHEPPE